MRRRVLLAAVTLAALGGCGESRAILEVASSDQQHLWARTNGPLGRGFCLTMVRGRRPNAVVRAIGGKSYQTVLWAQVVGPGDGERGDERYFLGIAGFGRWTMLLEDGPGGGLGMAETIAGRLSDGTDVVAYRGDATGRGTRRSYRTGGSRWT